jgi:hypothetical protein
LTSFPRKRESILICLCLRCSPSAELPLACGERVTSLLVQRSNQETPSERRARHGRVCSVNLASVQHSNQIGSSSSLPAGNELGTSAGSRCQRDRGNAMGSLCATRPARRRFTANQPTWAFPIGTLRDGVLDQAVPPEARSSL